LADREDVARRVSLREGKSEEIPTGSDLFFVLMMVGVSHYDVEKLRINS